MREPRLTPVTPGYAPGYAPGILHVAQDGNSAARRGDGEAERVMAIHCSLNGRDVTVGGRHAF